MYFFKPPSFLPNLSLRWVVLGISCHVPFVLISRVWWPPFTFLHLYFGLCSRDVGIYFPALCACIVHDVCIYILARPSWCDYHSPCHLRQSYAKVRWHVARFLQWKSSICLNALGKHRLQPHPFKSQNSKPHACKASKANVKIMFFIANIQKLRFYQNKGLSLDRCCGVPNTFPTRNQTSGLKNQDFFPSTLDLEMTSFLA